MNNLSSNFGLVNAKIRASDKDLPVQSSIFLSWNPIANSALFAFGPEWTPSTLAWQINLATITSPFIQYPVWMVLKKFNLRFCLHLNDILLDSDW